MYPGKKKLRCCENIPVEERVFDLGSEGERVWLLCEYHCRQKIFNQYIKSQKVIGEKIG